MAWLMTIDVYEGNYVSIELMCPRMLGKRTVSR